MLFRPGEIDVHVDVSSQSVTFKPGRGCICEMEADDCGEFELLIEIMKDLENRRTTLRDVLLWLKRPGFNSPPEVVFLDQELDEVTKPTLSFNLSLKTLFSLRKLQ